jgi:hypothetical protein
MVAIIFAFLFISCSLSAAKIHEYFHIAKVFPFFVCDLVMSVWSLEMKNIESVIDEKSSFRK